MAEAAAQDMLGRVEVVDDLVRRKLCFLADAFFLFLQEHAGSIFIFFFQVFFANNYNLICAGAYFYSFC